MGDALNLQRYIVFLEECSKIEQAVENEVGKSGISTQLHRLVMHREQFCGRIRCLKVLNGKTRRMVLEDTKKGLGMGCMNQAIELVINKVKDLLVSYQEVCRG